MAMRYLIIFLLILSFGLGAFLYLRPAKPAQRHQKSAIEPKSALTPTQAYEIFRAYGKAEQWDNMWEMILEPKRAEGVAKLRAVLLMAGATPAKLKKMSDFEVFCLIMSKVNFDGAVVTGEAVQGNEATIHVISVGIQDSRANDIHLVKRNGVWHFSSFIDFAALSRRPRRDNSRQQLSTVEKNRNDRSSLSDDEMHIGACAGEYMWLALIAEKMYSPTDPRNGELKRIAFWFQRQADDILGQARGIAFSRMTAHDLSERAEKTGVRKLVIELLSRTADCQALIIKLKPETAQCFELQSDPGVGVTYRFTCN